MSKPIDNNIICKARECLSCTNPQCVKHCPLGNDIPSFINAVQHNDGILAYKILSETTCLGSICGGVCPHSKQCQGHCVKAIKGKGVDIGEIEQYISDNYAHAISVNNSMQSTTIAVIGAGPAGLACAINLAQRGAKVTILEQRSDIGGVPRYSIPEFRLEKIHIKSLSSLLREYGINIIFNCKVGKDVIMSQLSDSYTAVFVSTGLSVANKLCIDGEQLEGVIYSDKYLESPIPADNVVVIGGGNTAIDCARYAIRLGTDVTVVYRRTRAEMPACPEETDKALAEGIKVIELCAPRAIVGNKRVEAIELDTMKLSTIGADGRASVVKDNGMLIIPCQLVVVATGSYFDQSIVDNSSIIVDKYGIVVDDNNYTGIGNIYAGGDITNNVRTVVGAVRDGTNASRAIVLRYGSNKE